MNAAAKYINQSSFFHGQLAGIRMSSMNIFQIGLVIALLISSLAVVTVTNMHRVTISQLEIAESKSHQLELKWGKLLLEQASLAAPARVEEIATNKLDMIFIDNTNTNIISSH